jgi:hypothetical protein
VDRHERDELTRFLDSYDRGMMPGVTIPESLVTGMRRLLAEWVPGPEEKCSVEECVEVGTWEYDGSRFCETHPFGSAPAWRWRYQMLRNSVESAISAQSGSFQEARHRLENALKGIY